MRALAALMGGLLAILWAGLVQAAPTFPPLTGRVVDQANLLDPAAEQRLANDLQAFEQRTGHQFVVVTLSSLQGYEIEEYGYQLGRAWGIGGEDRDDGVLLIVAPEERKVRIEVGYGLEPVLTDALSSLIIQERILPAFREGRFSEGVASGAEAVMEQLSLDRGEAEARAQAAAERADDARPSLGWIIPVIFFLIFFFSLAGAARRGRGRRLSDAALPVILWEIARHSSGRGGGWGGGGGFGGGGFSGGGGSFGGGGASGGW